jgi:hypothetical protein
MSRDVLALAVLTSVLVVNQGGSFLVARPAHQSQSTQTHVEWVSDVLKRMHTITVGMTRRDLLKVFGPQPGGISNRLSRTYASLDCPMFKVSVQFKPVGVADIDNWEGSNDTIVEISKPFIEFPTID